MKALRTSILAAVSAGLACPSTQPAVQAEPTAPPSALTAEHLPSWATGAVLADQKLWLMGAVGGQLMHFERDVR